MIKRRKLIVNILFSFCIVLSLILNINNAVNAQDELPYYEVQSGDTLYTIALRFNISPEDIINENGITDPNFLNAGDLIRIPGLEGISGTLTTQTIAFGLNLVDICRQNQINCENFCYLNKYTSPVEIFAGSQMLIPINEDKNPNIASSTFSLGESSIEFSAKNNLNPWNLAKDNLSSSNWKFVPNERLYSNRETFPEESASFINEISIKPLPIIQGETFVVKLQLQNLMAASATINGSDLLFQDTNGAQVSIHGIGATAETKPTPIVIQLTDKMGEVHKMEQWALITPGPYITDPEIFVDPETVDPVNIAAEDAIFESIITQITADKYWQGTFVPPVLDETCIRGYFGNRRSYNNGALLYYHTGVDFGYCLGTEVFAPASGKVVLLEEDLIIRGNAILIDHGWGVYSGYWHLAEFNVALGDMVDPGQLIGIMGNTGRSQGPHLHFEIIVNGISVNPLTWLEKEFP